MIKRAVCSLGAVLLCTSLAACAMHWPWQRRARPAPQPVQELLLQAADPVAAGSAILQFWDRNALLVDLTAVGSEGTVRLRTQPGHSWPIRLEFRVQPGGMGRLEVQATERVIFVVPAQGKPLLLKLAPDAYARDAPQITLRWRAAADSAR
jgi:hypothetical protein